jgi:hypothetical protein
VDVIPGFQIEKKIETFLDDPVKKRLVLDPAEKLGRLIMYVLAWLGHIAGLLCMCWYGYDQE